MGTMTGEIVRAYTPSNLLKDYFLASDADHHWYYEQRTSFYDTGHKKYQAVCEDYFNHHPRAVGQEPYYDIVAAKTTSPPRHYLKRYPKKGEWEQLKTIDDLQRSRLYAGTAV